MRPPGLFAPLALVALVASAVAGVCAGLMAVLGLGGDAAHASAKQTGRTTAVVRMLIARVERTRRWQRPHWTHQGSLCRARLASHPSATTKAAGGSSVRSALPPLT
jgi:hypothetical protein